MELRKRAGERRMLPLAAPDVSRARPARRRLSPTSVPGRGINSRIRRSVSHFVEDKAFLTQSRASKLYNTPTCFTYNIAAERISINLAQIWQDSSVDKLRTRMSIYMSLPLRLL